VPPSSGLAGESKICLEFSVSVRDLAQASGIVIHLMSRSRLVTHTCTTILHQMSAAILFGLAVTLRMRNSRLTSVRLSTASLLQSDLLVRLLTKITLEGFESTLNTFILSFVYIRSPAGRRYLLAAHSPFVLLDSTSLKVT
jgi:hypothetical protein